MAGKEQKAQSAKITLEVDGKRFELETKSLLLVAKDGKGTHVRSICRGGGEELFELYRNTRDLIEEWEQDLPELRGIYEKTKDLEALLKSVGIGLDDSERGADDE